MPQIAAEFMRFSAPDPGALERSISETRAKLAIAVQAGQSLAIVDAAADLGSMLTTARMEVEAAQLLEEFLPHAEAHAMQEAAGWFWNAYATALQYCGRREQAEAHFAKAIEIATVGDWRRLEALVLHHWGRSLAEQTRFVDAEARISKALAIRVELNIPNQESSRRALVELSALREANVHP
ncbi:tetratricopeptide repeat protein [Paucibacter sp. TC2R-5]|uniref:tetratricopeptide repeat protein n=1 Tax=Paucibacter sp. TC2R-5 TaxID=2893555 RepID=UPI0021E50B7E|nr:tetratricopeptide repeat protein [Paucibacter sp. TC2R-5]MCV2360032.1 tetratricopeptide repeat protein [Paucibacter sp. TC2R-5]